jgi:hypothetical protein
LVFDRDVLAFENAGFVEAFAERRVSFDYLVGAGELRRWDVDADRFGGF